MRKITKRDRSDDYNFQSTTIRESAFTRFCNEIGKGSHYGYDTSDIIESINKVYDDKYSDIFDLENFIDKMYSFKICSSKDVFENVKNTMKQNKFDEDKLNDALHHTTTINMQYAIKDLENSLPIFYEDLENVLNNTLIEAKNNNVDVDYYILFKNYAKLLNVKVSDLVRDYTMMGIDKYDYLNILEAASKTGSNVHLLKYQFRESNMSGDDFKFKIIQDYEKRQALLKSQNSISPRRSPPYNRMSDNEN